MQIIREDNLLSKQFDYLLDIRVSVPGKDIDVFLFSISKLAQVALLTYFREISG
jgi:hypothetical protein